ncbi:MAG: polysaccharide deacetylase family protein [Chloroflexi bacterium]|nr:polysaccharide deacetylase family protein [Chloroflexota bacterium]
MRTSRRIAVVILILVGILGGGYQLMNARTFQLFGTLVARAQTSGKVVALTFDDGPQPVYTDQVLGVLDELGVKATFFVTGSDLQKHMAEAQQIVAAGHALGNHSFSHQRMILVTPAFVRDEIERTDQLIREAGYSGEIYFRPPYGKKLVALPYYLSQTNRTTIMWDVEPESDPAVAAASERISAHILRNVQPGSIILLHVMFASGQPSRDAVRDTVVGLQQAGYRLVTVPELLAMQAQE